MRFLLPTAICLCLAGCVYKSGSPELYDVTSDKPGSSQVIAQRNIKYMCKTVWSFNGADASRDDCAFVSVKTMNQTGLLGEAEFTYAPISDADATALQLHPYFSWWRTHGVKLGILLTVLYFVSYQLFRFLKNR